MMTCCHLVSVAGSNSATELHNNPGGMMFVNFRLFKNYPDVDIRAAMALISRGSRTERYCAEQVAKEFNGNADNIYTIAKQIKRDNQ